MPEPLIALFAAYPFGDLASVVGLLVALIGFTATIWTAWRSKTAAEAAAEAARQAREQVLNVHTSTSLASVISRMEALKVLHRAGRMHQMPERYSTLATDLMAIRSRNRSLTAHERGILQQSVLLLRGMEYEMDQWAQHGETSIDIAQINRAISLALDDISTLLHDLEKRLQDERDDD